MKTPQDYYFAVGKWGDSFTGNIVVVALTSKEYFERYKCLDDSLGAHSLSKQVRQALDRAGVYSKSELAESEFETIDPNASVLDIRNAMLREGFVENQDFLNFLSVFYDYDEDVYSPEIEYKKGDKVKYIGNTEGRRGQKGKIHRIREDGKHVIKFEDNKLIAVSKNHILPENNEKL